MRSNTVPCVQYISFDLEDAILLVSTGTSDGALNASSMDH